MPETILGDIRRDSLMEIWENHATLDLLRNRSDRTGHCASCDYRLYCGGCRARAYGYFGDMRRSDPGCVRNQGDWDGIADRLGPEAPTEAVEEMAPAS